MSENQTWQEQLQQRAGDLVARRLGDFAEELQTVQTALNGIRERLQGGSVAVTAEETTGLQECLEQARYTALQEAETGYQTRLEQAVQQTREETATQIRQEYEAQLQTLRSQLEAAQQSQGSVTSGLGMAAAGAVGLAVGDQNSETRYASLHAAIAEIDAQRQQADVLSSLVKHAAHYAPRVVFFVIKSGNVIGWKATGFTNGLSDETVRSLNLSTQSYPLLHEATANLHTASAQNTATGILGNFDTAVAQAVAVPLVIRGKAAAVLYADAGTEGGTINVDALEALMHVTSMAIELLPVRRTQPAAAPQPVPAPAPPAPAPAAPFAYKPEPEEAPAAPTPVVAPMPVTAEVKEAAPATVAQAQPSSLQSDEEVRAHNDARRFARLLVSEIKLYNEQKVIEGRRSHDLYERLKEDIDRSRQMYEKRVSASVAAKFDYFYDELLHTLGEGDPAKLGSGCPGPTVPVN
ncbi:MAG TPA: hypothetical protein VFZ34_00945 [Blastocatellia bacterium]|nr:hypothetical protein [Blastocatellia bacterium]